MPSLTAASTALRVSTSQTASWKDAATSATGHRLAGPLARLDPAGDRGLEPGEREVEAVPLEVASRGQTAREVDGDLVAVAGGAVDVGAAGERQPEQPRHLVERLAGRVVDRRPERLDVAGDVRDPQQTGVAAGHQQRQARLGQRPVLELVDGDVRGEVVDAVERLAEPDREGLGRRDADQQRAGEAGSAGDRDRVDVVQLDAGGLAGPLDRRHHRLEVRPAGDLGHDAAEPGVLVDAAGDRVGQQRVAAHDPDAGLVAGRLDAEDERGVGHGRHRAGGEWGDACRGGLGAAATCRSCATSSTPTGSLGAWRLDEAAAVVVPGGRWLAGDPDHCPASGRRPGPGRLLAAAGRGDRAARPGHGRRPDATAEVVPDVWRLTEVRHWHWMLEQHVAAGARAGRGRGGDGPRRGGRAARRGRAGLPRAARHARGRGLAGAARRTRRWSRSARWSGSPTAPVTSAP